ncbi:MAG: isoprenylcysteine carboxylmethyltransferase family protein [Cyanothece sp. SIO1E1]|nr:isoprenylcysteine carboxylmethyltransferase family protein [Cyanothece sp. SIO1E1]
METVTKIAKLVLALIALIMMLIVGPSIGLGIALSWQIVVLALSYFCFFLGTVWRVVRYGELTSPAADEQVKNPTGRVASSVTLIGLLGVHWLGLYNFAHLNWGAHKAVEPFLPAVAIGLIGLAILVNQLAIRTLGKFFDRLTIKADHQLVTNGIYRLIRHPIYTSYIFLFLGFCIMLQSWASLMLLAAVCTLWFGNRIGIEEHMLEQEFGQAYTSYCQQTKRLFPYIY